MTYKKVFVKKGEKQVTQAVVASTKEEIGATASFFPDLIKLALSGKRSGNIAFSWPKGQHEMPVLEMIKAGLMSRFQTHTAYINLFLHSTGVEMDSVNLRIPIYRFGANIIEQEQEEMFYEEPFEAPKILHLPSTKGLKIELEETPKKIKKAAKPAK